MGFLPIDNKNEVYFENFFLIAQSNMKHNFIGLIAFWKYNDSYIASFRRFLVMSVWARNQLTIPLGDWITDSEKKMVYFLNILDWFYPDLKINVFVSYRLCFWHLPMQVPNSLRRAVRRWLQSHITCIFASLAGCSFRLVPRFFTPTPTPDPFSFLMNLGGVILFDILCTEVEVIPSLHSQQINLRKTL